MASWQAVPPHSLHGVIHQTGSDGIQRVASGPGPNSFLNNLLRGMCCFGGDLPGSIPLKNSMDKGPLLNDILAEDKSKMCLVLDLDETLVHSTFRPIPNPDYVLPIDIEGTIHHVYVQKRPGADIFLEEVGKLFEVVVYTASLGKYADPLLDLMDLKKVIRHRLFRESCTFHEGTYVKDLVRLGRDIKKTIIVDNSPASYLFQPENAIGISSFIDDPADKELFYCLEFLRTVYNKDSVFSDLPNYHAFVERLAEEDQNKLCANVIPASAAHLITDKV